MTAVSLQQTSPAPHLLPSHNRTRFAAASSSANARPSPTHVHHDNHALSRHDNLPAPAATATATLRDPPPAMALRSEFNGTSAPTADSNGVASRAQPVLNGRPAPNQLPRSDDDDDDQRPSSAPGRRNGNAVLETRDDIEHHQQQRPSKPLLLRSKSDYARPMDEPEIVKDDIPEWGARHGFEDHYQSEDIISDLANVSCASHSVLIYWSACADPPKVGYS